MNHPFYKIKFSSTSCNFEIRINDIPIFTYVDAGMISTQYPINHLILESGNQEVTLRLWPQAEKQSLTEHSKLKISILVNDALESSKIPDNAMSFETPKFDKPIPIFEFKGEFRAQVPFSLKGWSESTDLIINESLTKEVYAFYNDVHRILLEKNFNAYKAIYSTKLKEIDTSIYSSQEETDNEWNELVSYLSNPAMKVAPLSKSAVLFLYGKEKVISLQQTDLDPVLFFENKMEKTQYQIPVFLHKPKGFALEVIR